MFCRSDLWINQENYFEPGQFLLADSAYPISTITVPVIKGVEGLTVDGRDFNQSVANIRACNEHVMGMLKQKWRSLTELPIRISKGKAAEDIEKCFDWITACAILHNFLIGEREIVHASFCTPHRGTRPAGGHYGFPGAPTAEQLHNGAQFRQRVVDQVLPICRAPGGFAHFYNDAH